MTMAIRKNGWVTQTINNRQDFIDDCANYCGTFRTQLGEEKLLIAYVRRGKRPDPNIFIEGTNKTPAQTTSGDAAKHIRVGRQSRKRPQGVVISFKDDNGMIMIGWSLCRKTEPFSKIVGLRYALERAISLEELKELPQCYRSLEHRLQRASGEVEERLLQKIRDLHNLPPHSINDTLNRVIERTEQK